MANNIFGQSFGSPNPFFALDDVDISTLNLTSSNTNIIFGYDPTNGIRLSWRPNRQINDFTTLTKGGLYEGTFYQDLDLTAYVGTFVGIESGTNYLTDDQGNRITDDNGNFITIG